MLKRRYARLQGEAKLDASLSEKSAKKAAIFLMGKYFGKYKPWSHIL